MAVRFEHRNGRRVAVHYPNTDAQAAQSWAALRRKTEKFLAEGEAGKSEDKEMRSMDRKIRPSLDADIKAGAAADECRFRFKEVDESEVDEHRHSFALALAAWATVELGSTSAMMVGPTK